MTDPRDTHIAHLEIQLAEQREHLAAIEQLTAAREENERLRRFVADVSDNSECLPGCDSYAHEEGCPVAHPVEAWRGLRAEVERLRAGAMTAAETADLFADFRRHVAAALDGELAGSADLIAWRVQKTVAALRRQRDEAVGALRESVRIHDHGCTGCRYDKAEPEVCEGTCVSMNEIRTALAALNNPEGSGDAE